LVVGSVYGSRVPKGNDCAERTESVEEEEHLMASVLFGITNEGSDIGIFGVVESLSP